MSQQSICLPVRSLFVWIPSEPVEWLQWVLIPRMHTLIDNAQPLPQAFAVAPYYEMALAADHPQRDILLAALQELDALFTSDNA